MTVDEKNILKEKIISNIEALQKQIAILNEDTKPIAKDCCMDEIARTELLAEQEVQRKILESSILRLSQLQLALKRIDTQMFGICIECEEDIGFGRMSIRPESIRCVACENEYL